MSEEDQKIFEEWLRNDPIALEGFLITFFARDTDPALQGLMLSRHNSDFFRDLASWIKRQNFRPAGQKLTLRQREAVLKSLSFTISRLFTSTK